MTTIAQRTRTAIILTLAGTLSLALAGCSLETTASPNDEAGAAIKGSIHGGQQPIAGAHVYLLAASTSNYGAASTSLLTSGTAMSPATTGYAQGQFSGPTGIAIDFAGSIWVSNATNNSVTQMIGLAASTVTPLSLAVKNFTVGTRP